MTHPRDRSASAPVDPEKAPEEAGRFEPGEVTSLLRDASAGKPGASDALINAVYQDLRKIAQNRLNVGFGGDTLQATEIVNEAYLKIAGNLEDRKWENRAQFFAAAAEAMRWVLIDHARKRASEKRGGKLVRVSLEEVPTIALSVGQADAVLALNDAFEQLAAEKPPLADVVRLRFFGGMTVAETADALDRSPRSVIRDWTFARAWLRAALEEG